MSKLVKVVGVLVAALFGLSIALNLPTDIRTGLLPALAIWAGAWHVGKQLNRIASALQDKNN